MAFNIHAALRSSTTNFGCSANSSNTDIASRTGNRRCVHLTPEENLHQQWAINYAARLQ